MKKKQHRRALTDIPRQCLEQIQRMVKRNEKTPLRYALDGFIERQGDCDIVCTEWYLAACHSRGRDVASILVDAGIQPATDAPLHQAAARGQWDIVETMLSAYTMFEPFSPYHTLDSAHILTRLAADGQSEVLRRALQIPCVEKYSDGKEIMSLDRRANFVMEFLTRIKQSHAGHKVVPVLMMAGANPDWLSPKPTYGSSGPRPFVIQALENGQDKMVASLIRAGANKNLVISNEYQRALQSCLAGMADRDFSGSQAHVLSDRAWPMLSVMASAGYPPPRIQKADNGLVSMDKLVIRFAGDVGRRIESVFDEQAMEARTAQSVSKAGHRRPGPRL